jgi:hypothetical protein
MEVVWSVQSSICLQTSVITHMVPKWLNFLPVLTSCAKWRNALVEVPAGVCPRMIGSRDCKRKVHKNGTMVFLVVCNFALREVLMICVSGYNSHMKTWVMSKCVSLGSNYIVSLTANFKFCWMLMLYKMFYQCLVIMATQQVPLSGPQHTNLNNCQGEEWLRGSVIKWASRRCSIVYVLFNWKKCFIFIAI